MTTRLFPDDDDQEAFGHWDPEFVPLINEIKNAHVNRLEFNARTHGNIRANNQEGVPHLNAVACKRLGEFLLKLPSRWKTVSITGVGINDECVRALHQPSADSTNIRGRSAWTSVKTLKLGSNPIGSGEMVGVASILSNCYMLRYLSLSAVRLSVEGVGNIAPILSTRPSLKDLDLTWNRMGDHRVSVLSKALANVKTLENLWLNGNRISKYSSIAPLLEHAHGVKVLSLYANRIGDDFLCEMAPSLRNHGCIETICLTRNDQITDEGINNLLREVFVYESGKFIGDAHSANHSLICVGAFTHSEEVQAMIAINKMKKVSLAEKARQKILEGYFSTASLDPKVLDIDMKIIPYVLSLIARKTPMTDLTTRKTPTPTDGHRHDILYNVMRNWNVHTLFSNGSRERLRIEALQVEMEKLKEENSSLKRKMLNYDELDNENKRLRKELQRLK